VTAAATVDKAKEQHVQTYSTNMNFTLNSLGSVGCHACVKQFLLLTQVLYKVSHLFMSRPMLCSANL